MRKILLFAVLLLTLTLLPTVPVAAKKPADKPGPGPPPTEEAYYVTFTCDDITSDELELMRRRAHGGKHLDLITFPGEYSTLNFIGDVWGDLQGSHDGKLGIWVDLKTKKVGMSYQFDFAQEPLDFWVLESTYEGRGDWISDDGSVQVHFDDDLFEIWRYSEQDITYTRRLTFSVTIEEA